MHADYSMNLEALVRATLALLDRYAHLFRTGYRERVETYMRRSGKAAARRFAVELNRVFQHMLIAELRPPSAPVGFNAVCEVLQRHGIVVEAIVSADGSFIIAWERFQWVVRQEFAHANPRVASKERLAAEKRIFNALNERFELRHKPDQATPPRRKRGPA